MLNFFLLLSKNEQARVGRGLLEQQHEIGGDMTREAATSTTNRSIHHQFYEDWLAACSLALHKSFGYWLDCCIFVGRGEARCKIDFLVCLLNSKTSMPECEQAVHIQYTVGTTGDLVLYSTYIHLPTIATQLNTTIHQSINQPIIGAEGRLIGPSVLLDR